MPAWRAWDSLGACSMGLTVTPGSQNGYYIYNKNLYVNNQLYSTTSSGRQNIESDNIYTCVDGNWYGSACTFDLPNNNTSAGITFTNFSVHFEFSGHVNDYESAKWFNSTATYDHAYIGISIDPSVGISFDGEVDACIGLELGIVGKSEKTPVELEINYIPD